VVGKEIRIKYLSYPRTTLLWKTLIEGQNLMVEPVGQSADQAVSEVARFFVPRNSLSHSDGLFPILRQETLPIDAKERT
jgi:hypothetical protein